VDLRKFAQEAVVRAQVNQAVPDMAWEQIAKKKGLPYNEYVGRVKQSSDKRFLAQVSRESRAFKGFGGAELTGFQRKSLATMAIKRLTDLGHTSVG